MTYLNTALQTSLQNNFKDKAREMKPVINQLTVAEYDNIIFITFDLVIIQVQLTLECVELSYHNSVF